MKKILLGISIFLSGIFLIFIGLSAEKNIFIIEQNSYKPHAYTYYNKYIISSKYRDLFQEKLGKKYSQKWLEIQDFYVENKKIRFANIFSFKTFVCGKGKLIVEYSGEEKEIFTFDKEILEIEPCTFNIAQTKDENIFLIDFCLESGGGSGECLGIDMYYDLKGDTWTEGELFFTGYKNDKMVKLPISKTGINWKYNKQTYDELVEYMNKNYYFQ